MRLQARWARERFRRTGETLPWLLGYGAPELLKRALKIDADLTIVHSEAGLWVGRELLRRGKRVGIDFEDWFSHDLPPSARRQRPVAVLEELEAFVARRAHYVLAPSHAMSHALAQRYSIAEPTVIYNAFPWAERAALDGLRKDRRDATPCSLHWFSQTIGPDRGLEQLLAALPLLKNPASLYLRGACSNSTRRRLLALIPTPWHSSVVFLPLVPSEELPSRIAEHDIGFALESSSIPSRDLSVSNKLFHYLQSGLAIIASPTQGQTEVLGQCGEVGTILPDMSPHTLAQTIDLYSSQPALLARARRAALAAAEGPFSWERHQAGLASQANRALSFTAGRAPASPPNLAPVKSAWPTARQKV